MSLIKCPECGKEISDKALSCPHCGCPIPKIPQQRQNINQQTVMQQQRPKKKTHGCLAVFIGVAIALTFLAIILLSNETGSDNDAENTPVESQTTIIENAEQFSNISKKQLKIVMGKPISKNNWTNKTSKGNFKFTTWEYNKNSNHYEFIIADGKVVRLTIYPPKYNDNSKDNFKINGDEKSICSMFGISLGDNAGVIANTGVTYKISPVNDKVAEFDMLEIDQNAGTCGMFKITYNLNYFD